MVLRPLALYMKRRKEEQAYQVLAAKVEEYKTVQAELKGKMDKIGDGDVPELVTMSKKIKSDLGAILSEIGFENGAIGSLRKDVIVMYKEQEKITLQLQTRCRL